MSQTSQRFAHAAPLASSSCLESVGSSGPPYGFAGHVRLAVTRGLVGADLLEHCRRVRARREVVDKGGRARERPEGALDAVGRGLVSQGDGDVIGTSHGAYVEADDVVAVEEAGHGCGVLHPVRPLALVRRVEAHGRTDPDRHVAVGGNPHPEGHEMLVGKRGEPGELQRGRHSGRRAPHDPAVQETAAQVQFAAELQDLAGTQIERLPVDRHAQGGPVREVGRLGHEQRDRVEDAVHEGRAPLVSRCLLRAPARAQVAVADRVDRFVVVHALGIVDGVDDGPHVCLLLEMGTGEPAPPPEGPPVLDKTRCCWTLWD